TSRLAGLMSRWTTPSWWACSSPSAACTPSRATARKYPGLPAERSVARSAAGTVGADATGGAGRAAGGGPARAGPRAPAAAPRARGAGPRRDRLGQGLPLNELHGVVVHAALAADTVHRDDVAVVQERRRLRLRPEALQLPRVERGRERQHLQSHPPAERDLL